MVKRRWSLSTPAQQKPRFTVIGAFFCGLLEIIWLSQSIFTWKMSPQEDQWSLVCSTNVGSLLQTNALLTFHHKFGQSTPSGGCGGEQDKNLSTPWPETLHFSHCPAHRALLNRATARWYCCTEKHLIVWKKKKKKGVWVLALPTNVKHTSCPLPQGNVFPVTKEKKKSKQAAYSGYEHSEARRSTLIPGMKVTFHFY